MDPDKIGNLNQSQILELMRPKLAIDSVIKCNYQEFYNLELGSIGNLYTVEQNYLRFCHESNLSISKCETKVAARPVFESAKEKPVAFAENGINYGGRISLAFHSGREGLKLRIFGEGSYDPASQQPYLTKLDYAVINGIFITGLYALKLNCGSSFIETLFSVTKNNRSCKSHKLLMEYLKYQLLSVLNAGAELQDYATFLMDKVDSDARILRKKKYEDLLNFIYLLRNYMPKDILPCQKYVKQHAAERKEENQNNFFANAAENPDIFLKPQTQYLAGLQKENLVSLFELEERASKLEKDFSVNIAAALRERKVEDSDTMRELTKSYYSCALF